MSKDRKKKGIFFTPYKIAKDIFLLSYNNFDNKKGIKSILDPACGSCTFLSAAAHCLVKKGMSYKKIIRILYGYDLNEIFFKTGYLLIQLELKIKLRKAITNKPNNFKSFDFLKIRKDVENIKPDLFKTEPILNVLISLITGKIFMPHIW